MEANKPFTCKEDGKVRWFSPSIATVCSVCCWNDKGCDPTENLLFLFEKRGPGCPDNVGLYCMPCGYYDFADQYIRKGAVREVMEETGLEVDPKNLYFFGVGDGPSDNNGNVTLRYMTILDHELLRSVVSSKSELSTKTRGGEAGEVERYVLFDLRYIQKHREEFCFGHDRLVELITKNLDRIIGNRFYCDNLCEMPENKKSAKTLISDYKLISMSRIRKFLKKAAIMADVVKDELTEAVKDAREISKGPKESLKDFVETVKNPKSTREDLVGGAKDVLKKTRSAVKGFVVGDNTEDNSTTSNSEAESYIKRMADRLTCSGVIDSEKAESIKEAVDQIFKEDNKDKIGNTDEIFSEIWEHYVDLSDLKIRINDSVDEWLRKITE